MIYLKYIQYLYLVASVFFIYDAIVNFQTNGEIPYLSIFLAIMALVMFFVRRKLANRLDNQNPNK